jgi:CRISPR-associated protein Cas1
MNSLHLGGFGVEIQATNSRTSKELLIQDGRQGENLPERYVFKPRQCPHDSIIIDGKSGHISVQALYWLSAHNIPIFLLDYDGSTITSILPPTPTKPDIRIGQIQAASDPEKKLTIAKAFVEAKIQRSLEVLSWLTERYDIERETRATKQEAVKLGQASNVIQLRTVEGRTAQRYWKAYAKALPERLGFQGRSGTHTNRNANDPVNAALNYGYGFLKCEARKAINTVGLEPAVGFLHEVSSTQTAESLVFDLIEPFRFLADLSVIQAFESGWLNISDFEFTRDDYLYRIEFEARRRFLHLLKERFNSGVEYKGRRLKWDTVIEEKTSELARYLNGRGSTLSFQEPAPTLERQDNRDVRAKILSLSQSEARGLGIGKSELHYLREKAREPSSFKLHEPVRRKLLNNGFEQTLASSYPYS